MAFPMHRLRRLRVLRVSSRAGSRDAPQPVQFILPLFACPGEGVRKEIGSMPGNSQLSVDQLVPSAKNA